MIEILISSYKESEKIHAIWEYLNRSIPIAFDRVESVKMPSGIIKIYIDLDMHIGLQKMELETMFSFRLQAFSEGLEIACLWREEDAKK